MAEVLVDTSVIGRIVNSTSALHNLACDAVEKVRLRGDKPVLVTQVLIELWSVATRPENVNGFGWSPEFVAAMVTDLRSKFRIVDEPKAPLERWYGLVTKYRVSGKR